MRILCIGAGAIGICIGGSLAAEGEDVSFLVKPEQKDKFAGRELSILLKDQVKKVKHFSLITESGGLDKPSNFDCVLIAVKAFDTDDVIEILKKNRVSFKTILCLQNGVENEEKFRQAFPGCEIIGASIVSAVSRLDQTSVQIEKNRGIGLCGNGIHLGRIYDSLNGAGLKPKIYSDLQAMKWSKMISNLFANATSGILDMTPMEIYSREGLFRIERAQILEGLAVMKGADLKVENLPGLPLKMLVFVIRFLPDVFLQPLLIRLIAGAEGKKCHLSILRK